MDLVFALEPLPEVLHRSIFLAGPTPRDDTVQSWRLDAIQILKDDLKFDGTVFIPEPRHHRWHSEYDHQVEWEEKCLNVADAIVFWIPRSLKYLPGLTTNIEWGRWENSGKILLGYPTDAEKMTYLHYYAKKFNISVATTLREVLKNAIEFIGVGVRRTGGERMIPYYIWKTSQFQSWYQNLLEANNRLDDARVLFQFSPQRKGFIFLFVLLCDVYITKENRHKTNEFLLSRPDISSVLLWSKNRNEIFNSEVVIVREYRTCSSTNDGYIRELPGGSTQHDIDPLALAIEEIEEETGFKVEPNRLKSHGKRQLAGTISSHCSHLFSIELTNEEMDYFRNQKETIHGLADDTERCYVEVLTVNEILSSSSNMDWTTIGQILYVVQNDSRIIKIEN